MLEREGQIEELVDGQNPGPETPPRSKKGKRGRSKGDDREGATARGAMEKGGCVRVIEEEEIRGDDPVEYQQWINSIIRNCSEEHIWILCGKHCE